MSEYGIKETKEMIGFSLAVTTAVVDSMEDGRIGITDALNFFGALKKAPAAFSGFSQIPAELNDLDEAEIEELIEYVRGEFDYPDELVKDMVLKSIKIGAGIYDLVGDISAFRKR